MSSKRRPSRGSGPAVASVSEPLVIQGSLAALDSFQNLLTRQGMGMPNLKNGTRYPLTRLDFDFNLLNSLYRNSWIAAAIVDVPAEDMLKNWITLKGQLDPEDLDDFERKIRQTSTREQILEGVKWGRLYGGAIGVIALASDRELAQLEEPLDLRRVGLDDYRGLRILDRWMGATPGSELVEDICSPDFGLPKYYTLSGQGLGGARIHHSRVVRFIGVNLPPIEKIAENYWGMSVLERVLEELSKRDNTSANIEGMVYRANIAIRRMNNLPGLMAGASGSDSNYRRILESLSAQNQILNNFSMQLLGEGEEMDFKSYSFSGLSEIYEEFMMDISGAAHIPATKLFGRAPAGMNSTGESDLQNYYDMISQEQETDLRPVLDKILPVIAMSLWGGVPDDLDYKFNSPRTVSDKDAAELARSYTDGVVAAYNANLITQRAAAKELRQQSDVTGVFSNITDEDIERASPEYLDGGGEDLGQFADLLSPQGAMDGEWEESQHPRAENGQFGSGGSSTGSEKPAKMKKSKYAPSPRRNPKGITVGKKTYARLTGTLNTRYPDLPEGEIRYIRDAKRVYRVKADGYGGMTILESYKIK